jgi:hypothetical protein
MLQRSQKNHTTLKHEQQSPGEWRQLRTQSIAKLAVLYCCAAGGWKVLPWPWSTHFGDSYCNYRNQIVVHVFIILLFSTTISQTYENYNNVHTQHIQSWHISIQKYDRCQNSSVFKVAYVLKKIMWIKQMTASWIKIISFQLHPEPFLNSYTILFTCLSYLWYSGWCFLP